MSYAAKEEIWNIFLELDSPSHFGENLIGIRKAEDILKLVKNNTGLAIVGHFLQQCQDGIKRIRRIGRQCIHCDFRRPVGRVYHERRP